MQTIKVKGVSNVTYMINLFTDINRNMLSNIDERNITSKDIMSLARLFENFIWIPVDNCTKDRLTK